MKPLLLLILIFFQFTLQNRYISISGGFDQGDCAEELKPCKTVYYTTKQAKKNETIYFKSKIGNDKWNCTEDFNIIITKDLTFEPFSSEDITFEIHCFFQRETNIFIFLNDSIVNFNRIHFFGIFEKFESLFYINTKKVEINLTKFSIKKINTKLIKYNHDIKNEAIKIRIKNSSFNQIHSLILLNELLTNEIFILIKDTSIYDILDTPLTLNIQGQGNLIIDNSYFQRLVDPIVLKNDVSFDINVQIMKSTFFQTVGLFLEHSNLQISDSYFIENQNENGGAINIENSFVSINSTLFFKNHANSNGGAIFLISEKYESIIDIYNSTFKQNYIHNALDKEYGSAIAMYSDFKFTMKYSKFESNYGTGKLWRGTIFLQSFDQNKVNFEGNEYISNFGYFGGALYLHLKASNVVLKKEIFISNEVLIAGGSIYCDDVLHLEIIDCEFINSNSKDIAGSILLNGGYSEIISSSFTNGKSNFGGAIQVQGRGELLTKNSRFHKNVVKYNGGGIVCSLTSKCLFENSEFNSNKASKGGAIYTYSGNLELIKGSKFIRNIATLGGSIYFSEGGKLEISTCNFLENRAILGGCIYYNTNSKNPPIRELYMERTTFENSFASSGGGIFYFSGEKLNPIYYKNVTKNRVYYVNSNAGFGPNFATNPKYAISKMNDIKVHNEHSNVKIIKIHPNENLNLKFQIFDEFNQEMKSHPSFNLKIRRKTKNYEIFGSSSRIIENRFVQFSDNSLKGKIGNNFTLELYSGSHSNIEISKILIELKKCPMRYKMMNDTNGFIECKLCPSNYYSLGPGYCEKCPSYVFCEEDQIIAYEGYWLYQKENEPIEVFFCENGNCNDGKCNANRDETKPICGACKDNFEEWSGNCVESTGSISISFIYWLALSIIQIFFILIIFHILSQSKSSGSITIFFFFLQTILLFIGRSTPIFRFLRAFNLEIESSWGSLHIFEQSPFKRSSYFKLLFPIFEISSYFLIYLFIILILYLFQFLNGLFKNSRNREYIELNESHINSEISMERKSIIQSKVVRSFFEIFIDTKSYITTLINLILLTYQPILNISMSYFHCRKFGNSIHLISSTDIICFDPKYFEWIPIYMFLLIYSILFPILLLIFLIILKNKKMLYSEKIINHFGNLYLHFKPNFYFFEVIFLFKRIILNLILFIFTITSIHETVKYFVTSISILIFLFFQLLLKPFELKRDNHLNEISLFFLSIILLFRGYLTFDLTQFWIWISILFLGLCIIFILFFSILNTNSFIIYLKHSIVNLFKKKKFDENDIEEFDIDYDIESDDDDDVLSDVQQFGDEISSDE
eukprot:gene148-4394_t